MRENQGIEDSGRSGAGGIAVLLQAHGKTLVDFGIAFKEREQGTARDFSDTRPSNGGDSDGSTITQQIEATREVVAALTIGDDAFIAFSMACTRGCATRHFDKAFQHNMHRFAYRPARSIFAKEAFVAVVLP